MSILFSSDNSDKKRRRQDRAMAIFSSDDTSEIPECESYSLHKLHEKLTKEHWTSNIKKIVEDKTIRKSSTIEIVYVIEVVYD